MNNILQEFAYLSNVDLELVLECRFHEYQVYKKSLLIALEILYQYNFRGLVITSLEKRKSNIKRYEELAKLRMVNIKKREYVKITYRDVANVLREIEDNYIFKLREENKSISGTQEYFDNIISSLEEVMLKREK